MQLPVFSVAEAHELCNVQVEFWVSGFWHRKSLFRKASHRTVPVRPILDCYSQAFPQQWLRGFASGRLWTIVAFSAILTNFNFEYLGRKLFDLKHTQFQKCFFSWKCTQRKLFRTKLTWSYLIFQAFASFFEVFEWRSYVDLNLWCVTRESGCAMRCRRQQFIQLLYSCFYTRAGRRQHSW